jgi:hypothetical protein
VAVVKQQAAAEFSSSSSSSSWEAEQFQFLLPLLLLEAEVLPAVSAPAAGLLQLLLLDGLKVLLNHKRVSCLAWVQQ